MAHMIAIGFLFLEVRFAKGLWFRVSFISNLVSILAPFFLLEAHRQKQFALVIKSLNRAFFPRNQASSCP